jgi:hypothetical protein
MGVLVVTAIILVAVGFYFVLLPHAEVKVRVENDHSTSMEYQLNLDDRTFISGGYIPPFQYDEETIRVGLKSRGCDRYVFTVIAETLDGSYTDSTMVTLCDGDKTTITLNP